MPVNLESMLETVSESLRFAETKLAQFLLDIEVEYIGKK